MFNVESIENIDTSETVSYLLEFFDERERTQELVHNELALWYAYTGRSYEQLLQFIINTTNIKYLNKKIYKNETKYTCIYNELTTYSEKNPSVHEQTMLIKILIDKRYQERNKQTNKTTNIHI